MCIRDSEEALHVHWPEVLRQRPQRYARQDRDGHGPERQVEDGALAARAGCADASRQDLRVVLAVVGPGEPGGVRVQAVRELALVVAGGPAGVVANLQHLALVHVHVAERTATS
eukprot:10589918-Alexandrium_andersonii.AAC.1